MASGTWCVWLLPQWQKPPLTRWTFARPGEITLVNSKSPSRSSWLFLIINRPHSSQAPDSGGVVLWQRKRKSLQRDDPHHVWNCQRGGFSHSQNKNHKIYELFFVFRGCSSCGEACCRLFTDMQYIPVGINLSVAVGCEFSSSLNGHWNHQYWFSGFRMSAYEQIRNRLSSNGKVCTFLFFNLNKKRQEQIHMREKYFQDKNGFSLWKKVVAGMSAGGEHRSVGEFFQGHPP